MRFSYFCAAFLATHPFASATNLSGISVTANVSRIIYDTPVSLSWDPIDLPSGMMLQISLSCADGGYDPVCACKDLPPQICEIALLPIEATVNGNEAIVRVPSRDVSEQRMEEVAAARGAVFWVSLVNEQKQHSVMDRMKTASLPTLVSLKTTPPAKRQLREWEKRVQVLRRLREACAGAEDVCKGDLSVEEMRYVLGETDVTSLWHSY